MRYVLATPMIVVLRTENGDAIEHVIPAGIIVTFERPAPIVEATATRASTPATMRAATEGNAGELKR